MAFQTSQQVMSILIYKVKVVDITFLVITFFLCFISYFHVSWLSTKDFYSCRITFLAIHLVQVVIILSVLGLYFEALNPTIGNLNHGQTSLNLIVDAVDMLKFISTQIYLILSYTSIFFSM